MAKRFIRWILPLLVVMTIAIAFMAMSLSGAFAAHAAAPTKHITAPISTPTTIPSGITPNMRWGA